MGRMFAVWVLLGCLGFVPCVAQVAGGASGPLAFEVSAVKRNKSGGSGSQSSMNGGRFIATNTTLKNLMEYSAFGLPESRIVGGPKWVDAERFDIQATMDSATVEKMRKMDRVERKAEMQRMFQQMLAERFKLVVHRETRELPIYEIVAAKGGPKLTPTKEKGDGSSVSVNNDLFEARGATMAQIAGDWTQEFSRELGRVVVDKTGLEGRYDVSFRWTPDTGAPVEGEDHGSIFTVVQEQLGLKLQPGKGPVEVLVVDRVEMPEEN